MHQVPMGSAAGTRFFGDLAAFLSVASGPGEPSTQATSRGK